MEGVAIKYFQDLFKSSSPAEFDDFLEEIPSLVTEDQNVMLLARESEEEVRKALFMMHPEKTPGPDGMTTLFYNSLGRLLRMISLTWLIILLLMGFLIT